MGRVRAIIPADVSVWAVPSPACLGLTRQGHSVDSRTPLLETVARILLPPHFLSCHLAPQLRLPQVRLPRPCCELSLMPQLPVLLGCMRPAHPPHFLQAAERRGGFDGEMGVHE